MSTVVKDLGAVSAYAYAVEKGYTGTEAEFAELMADYAEVGQRAEDAADSALESKTAAQTAATTATNKATEATTAATTATTKAGEASTSASTATSAKDTAVSASQTATSKATEAATAAATATSAATTATTAKDDAVSAKTAAQTAQTGAETAAASVQSSAEQIATNTEDIAQLKSDLNQEIHGTFDSWELYLNGSRASSSDANYWRFSVDLESLTKGVKYLIRFTPNSTFTQASIQVGTGESSSAMVATIGTNVAFTSGVPVDIEYTPAVDNVSRIRVYGNADKFSSIETFTEHYVGGIEGEISNIESESTISHIERTNSVYAKINKLKSDIEKSIPSLLSIKNGETQSTKTITLSSVGAKKKYIVPIRMHYESSRFNPQENDVFFDKTCNKDFSDVRFFDSNGKMLKARLGEPVNLDFLTDTSIYAFPKLLPLSNGYCIASFGDSGKGVYISKTQCHNWGSPLSGTSDVSTSHPSDVNHYVSMFAVGVDSSDNVYAYAGGKLYKCVPGSDYSYGTKTEVLDFSWTDTTNSNTVIYPDIQPSAFAIDGDGRMYIGLYQEQYRGCVYVSSDGGNTWTQKYVTGIGASASNFHQHVHHIKYDSYQNKVYVCIDDGNATYNGGFVLTTTDGGDTWTDISESISGLQDVRGKDYYPCYCGNGYRLGSGETYILGGACTIRSEDDIHFDHVVKGFAATRSIVDFGDDSVLLTGTQVTVYSSENLILVSYDKGKTWKTVSRTEQTPLTSGGGAGYRQNLSATLFADETEPCCVLTNSESSLSNLKRTRVYKGADHYFREAYILLEDIPNESIVITAKTGYAVEYPYQELEGYEVDGLVYQIPFDEGSGTKAEASDGTVANLPFGAEWDSKAIPVRCGEFGGDNTPEVFEYYSAIKLNESANFGKVTALNFNKNYTITFWLNEKGRLNNYPTADRLDQPFAGATAENVIYKLMRVGTIWMIRYNNYIGFIPKTDTDTTRATFANFNSAIPFCNDYSFIAVEVGNGSISVSINGSRLKASTVNNCTSLNAVALNLTDILIGSSDKEMPGYIGNVKIYNKLLTQNELLNIYKGYQFK